MAALVLVATATIVLALLRDALSTLNLVSIGYLVPVLIAANRWGIWAAVAAALAGAAAADYFFYPPLYSFEIGDAQNLADLAVFLIVAFVTSDYADRRKRDADALRRGKRETEGLFAFSRRLAACFTVSELISATELYLSETLGRRAYLVGEKDIYRDASGGGTIPEPIRQQAAAMMASAETQSRAISDSRSRETWLIRVVPAITVEYAAIVDLGTGSRKSTEAVGRRVDAALDEVAVTLARLGIANALEEAKLRSESEALRDALIGSVSHELRSPLTSILGSASVLEQMPSVTNDPAIHSLVEAVHEQAGRLDGEIQYLLSAARMTAKGRPHLEWADPADLLNAAVRHQSARLAAHHVELEVAPHLPLVHVSSALVEQALGQLVENAAKYSPIDSKIKISARVDRNQVVLSVSDQGAGLAPDEIGPLGERAFRGGRHLADIPGTGLGLWIASTFIKANGGVLDAESPGPGLGTTVSIRLPVAGGETGVGNRSS